MCNSYVFWNLSGWGPFSPPENITVDIFTKSDCYYEYANGIEKKINPTGVMLRSYNTLYEDLKNAYNIRTEESNTPSWHINIFEHKAYICSPLNSCDWHCGGTCNYTHLSIMMIESPELEYSEDKSKILTSLEQLTDGQRESYKKTYNTTVWIAAFLVYYYDMNLEDPLTVIGHCEAYKMTPDEHKSDRN